MVLPKGWWLQDRRSDATLFTAEVAPTAPTYRPKRPRRRPPPLPPLPLERAPGADAGDSADVPAPVPAWTPTFDAADDLDGLLAARTPLLSRAFGQPPPPPTS